MQVQKRPRVSVFALCGALAAVTVAGPAGAQLINPLEQNRQISTLVNATQCNGDFLFDDDAAKGFGVFNSTIETVHSCEFGHALARASQHSTILESAMIAAGQMRSEAFGPGDGIVHAIACSLFDVTFEVAAEREFALTGAITAEMIGVIGYASANIRLLGPGGETIIDEWVQHDKKGGQVIFPIHLSGVLSPGLYELRARADSVIDDQVPPGGVGEGSYDVTFVMGTAADLTDLAVVTGQLLEGGLDDLSESDDQLVMTNSSLGFAAFEPNLMEMVVGASIFGELPTSFHVTIESRIDHPQGVAKIRLFNWTSGQFQEIGAYSVGFDEEAVTFANVDATDRVRKGDARLELSIKHVVIATFSASGFKSSFDRVSVLAN